MCLCIVLFTWPFQPFMFYQRQNSLHIYFASWGKIDSIFLIWVTWKFSEYWQESELMFKIFSESELEQERNRSLKNVNPLVSDKHADSMEAILGVVITLSTFMRKKWIERPTVTEWKTENRANFATLAEFIELSSTNQRQMCFSCCT